MLWHNIRYINCAPLFVGVLVADRRNYLCLSLLIDQLCWEECSESFCERIRFVPFLRQSSPWYYDQLLELKHESVSQNTERVVIKRAEGNRLSP